MGGHAEAFTCEGGRITKLTCAEEAAFYEAAKCGRWPTSFLPAYYGQTTADGKTSITLEDLSQGLRHPCVLDVKMGQHTWVSDTKSAIKLAGMALVDKISGSEVAGVRLVGMKVYRPEEQTEFKADKKQGLKIGKDHTLAEILAFFLSDGNKLRTNVL